MVPSLNQEPQSGKVMLHWIGTSTGAPPGLRRPTSSRQPARTILPPGCKGFYLHPHIVLQGTARSAKDTVLYNENGVSLADIEYVTHALCFLHFVCLTPTAEPALLDQ